jgi:hypothetical protein
MVFSGLAKHSQNALRVYLLFEPQQLIAPRGTLEAPQTDEVLAPPASPEQGSPVLLTGVSSRPPAPIRKALSSISLSRATPEPLGAAPPAPTGVAPVRRQTSARPRTLHSVFPIACCTTEPRYLGVGSLIRKKVLDRATLAGSPAHYRGVAPAGAGAARPTLSLRDSGDCGIIEGRGPRPVLTPAFRTRARSP